MRLKDKVAVITGAASGIGRETCLLFAEQGAKVVAVDINEKEGTETIRKIHDTGGQALFFKADVSNAADCKNMIDTAVVQYGRLDILFNNAGIMHSKDDDAVNTEEEVFDLTYAVNVKGVFLGCKFGIPALRKSGGGVIINTASFVAKLGAATPQIAYTASKGAVLALTRELAVVHARGIFV